jgi:hypothetical protein
MSMFAHPVVDGDFFICQKQKCLHIPEEILKF